MQEFQLNVNGDVVLGRRWDAADPVASLLVVHGHGEHIGRYESVAVEWTRKGVNCQGINLYGHGTSGPKLGHWKSYDGVLDSIESLIQLATVQTPDLPLFLLGHSMGGNLAVNCVLRRKPSISGLILTSPWIQLANTPPFWKRLIAAGMVRFYPSMTLPTGVDPESISSDPEQVERYRRDPMVHDLMSAGMFESLQRGGEYALRHADQLRLPTYVIHGTADPLTHCDASRAFAESADQGQVTFLEVKDGRHELHHETGSIRQPVVTGIAQWIIDQATGKQRC